jgi:hypothetical protein
MGKSIVLAFEEMAHKYTSASQVVYIYELSKYGAKDLSHKIFGNIGGENVVLSGDKVYLIGASLADSSLSSNLLRNCVHAAYSPLWSSSDNGGLQRETFTKILTKRIVTPKMNTRWQKDTTSTNSKAFKFNMFNFTGYANLTTGIVNFVSIPEDMSEENLHEILDVYGGKEDFDVRQFMFDMEFIEENLNNEYINLLKHLCTSKSYILPSPIFISNYQVTGMLHLSRKMLGSHGVLSTFVKEFHTYRLQSTAEYRLYCSSAGTWGNLIEYALNPECLAVELFDSSNRVKRIDLEDLEFSSLPTRSSVLWDMLAEVLEGHNRNPVVKKLSKYKSSSLEPEFIPICKVPANLGSQIRKIMDYSAHAQGTLHSALLEASILSANRYASVLNSTTYLCRDMQKTIEKSVYSKVRWKGARKEQEKLLASRLYALRCVFKSPKLVKDLLNSCFLLNCYPYSNLSTFGEAILSLTERENTLRVPTEIAEKSNLLRTLHPLEAKYVIYLREGSDSNYQKVLSSATQVLVQMCNNKRVQDTVEAGIQVIGTGKLLVTEKIAIGTSGSISSLHMFDPYLSKKFNVEGDLHKSSTYLEELYYLLKESRQQHSEVDIREYVHKILECIEILNELRSTIALKSLESYYLNGPLVRFLSTQKWTNLLG